MSQQEAEQVFHQFADTHDHCTTEQQNAHNKHTRGLTYATFAAALVQVGQVCAQKLRALAHASPHAPQHMCSAAIYKTMQSTQWLVSGLTQRHWAAKRIRGSPAAAPTNPPTNAIPPHTHHVLLPSIMAPSTIMEGTRVKGRNSARLPFTINAPTEARMKVVARLSTARQQSQAVMLKEKSLILTRQAKGNEMSLTLQQLNSVKLAPSSASLHLAVHQLKHSVCHFNL